MVRLALLALASVLLVALLSPIAHALPFLTISNDYLDHFQARFAHLAPQIQPKRRYVTSFTPPSGYRHSWGIDYYRLSYGSSSGQYITRSPIAGATQVDQNAVNACAILCNNNARCNFFHPVQMDTDSDDKVICALYTTKQSKSAAKFDAGPGTTEDWVVASYGFTQNASPTTSSTTTSSTTTSTTTTTTRSTTTTTTVKPSTSTSVRTTASSSKKNNSATTKKGTTATATSTTTRNTSTTSSISTASSTGTSTTSTTGTSTTLSISTDTSSTFTSTASTTSTGSSSSQTDTTSSTSGTATASTSRLPASPTGATLIQYQACGGTNATIPMFVNKNYPINGTSSSSTAWIVQHGSGRNFEDYFRSLRTVVGDEGVIIAPNFYASFDSGRWYQRSQNLAWNSNDWSNGADAVAPAGVSGCSSFDVYDSLVEHLNDKTKFPSINQVFLVSHSAGSSMMIKYGAMNPDTGARYVLANPPSLPYFTLARPNSTANCTGFNNWGYGFGGSMPRYVAARNPGGEQAFRDWIAQDLSIMTGDLDTYARDQSGDQSCPVQAQGGPNRRDRGYAWWAYINLLGGTSTDVSQFYGYESFKNQSVTSLEPAFFGARYCVVDGVAHDNYGMFQSECGRAAITGADTLPPGPGPVRPP